MPEREAPEYETAELLGGGRRLWVSPAHTFGTDAFLLADFARSSKGALAADLGAGCGIIGTLLLGSAAAPHRVDCVEIQPRAVAQMERTVQENDGLKGKLCPVQADLRALEGVLPAGRYDLVVCNPPYKAANSGILSTQRCEQIARHEVLCTVEEVCAAAARLLRFGGRFCLCQRPERLADVIDALRRASLEPKRLRMVHKTVEHAPWLFLIEGRRGGKPSFLRVEPPLIVRGEQGVSSEVREIYERLGCGYGG